MGLVGDSSELSLVDLIQVKAHSPSTCRILLLGRRGPGSICLDRGAVVYAEYDGLRGEPAAHAILAEADLSYRATSDVALPERNMSVDHRALLLEAAVANDETRRTPPPIPTRHPSSRGAPAPGPTASRKDPSRRFGVIVGSVVGAAALSGLAAVAFGRISVQRSEAAAATPIPPASAPAPAPIEASELVAAGDELPVLLSGEPPRRTDPAVPLRPTVVLRLLVGASGAVIRAEVYRSRPELEPFERAALQAARAFTFRPARRGGAPVDVWINWPVDFL